MARSVAIVALLLAPTLAGEVAVRSLIAQGRIPVAAADESSVEVAWTNLERAGPTDIIVFGDSLARMGLHTEMLETLASRDAGRPVTAYNLATPGAGFPVYRAFVEELGRQGRLPKVAIIGISTVALQRDDALAVRALNSPFGRLVAGCGGGATVEQALSCRLESISALWRWRGHLDRLVGSLTNAVPATQVDTFITVEEDGYARGGPMPVERLPDRIERGLERTPRLAAAAPDVGGFRELVVALRSRGVPIVAVLMPYSPPFEDALEAREPGWAAERARILDEMARASGQPIVESSIRDWWTVDASHDIRHMTPFGARRFTRDAWRLPDVGPVIAAALRS